MSFSYDPSLSTDRDWVRFLVSDTEVATAKVQDEEIDAVLSEESGGVAVAAALKYVAAARILSMLSSRWASAGGGVMAKTLSRLRLEWGISGDTAEVINYRIRYLLKRASEITTSKPLAFKTLGRSTTRGF